MNEKTIVAVNAAVPCQSFSAGQVLHRERKRVRSLRVLVLLDTSTTSRILTNQSTSPTFVRHPPDAGQRRGKRTCLEARHSVKLTGKLFQSLTRRTIGFPLPFTQCVRDNLWRRCSKIAPHAPQACQFGLMKTKFSCGGPVMARAGASAIAYSRDLEGLRVVCGGRHATRARLSAPRRC